VPTGLTNKLLQKQKLFSFRNENLIELDRALIKNLPKALELELSILFSGVLRLFFQKTQIGNSYIFFTSKHLRKDSVVFELEINYFSKNKNFENVSNIFKKYLCLHFLKIFNRKCCQIVSGNLPS
jgi:hypothetical protein